MSDLVALDSQSAKESLSVAEARHLARAMLPEILDALHEIGMNPENKPAERTPALKAVLDFAEGAEGSEGKLIAKLRPEVARRLAKLGKDLDEQRTKKAEVLQDEAKR